MPKRQKLRHGLILFTFFLFPATFYYLSPALIIVAAAQGIINGSFIMFALLFLTAPISGRAWCGWICPAAGCQEALFAARDKKVLRGNVIKWFLWVPWICAIAILAVMAGGYSRVDFFYKTTYGLSIGDVQALITYYLVLLILIVLPALIFGRRSFCHHLCWMAPFMILGAKLGAVLPVPALSLRAEPEACRHCHLCTDNCPMSLPVERMVSRGDMTNSECILCGSCVDGCEHRAIGFAFAGRKKPPAISTPH